MSNENREGLVHKQNLGRIECMQVEEEIDEHRAKGKNIQGRGKW